MNNLTPFFIFIIPIIVLGDVDEFGSTNEYTIPEMFTTTCPPDTPAGWRDDERLSLNDANESINPRGVSDALGRIHVVWKDNRRLGGYDQIDYRVRIDTIWDTLCAISNLDTVHNSPWITIDKKNNAHVVFLRRIRNDIWTYFDIGYRKYNDSLSAWEPEERLTYYDSTGYAGRPKILCDTNDVVYAIWLNENDVPITIWYVTNDGTGWSSKLAVTDANDSPNGYFGVAAAPDNKIHCIWQDYRSGISELYHRYYENGSWSPSVAVTTNGFASAYPRLAADTLSNIHLVYGGGTSLSEKIHYLIWDSSTQTWGPETKFPSQMGLPHVDIAVSSLDSDVHLTFHESINGHIEIMYKHYDSQTGQWEPNVQLTFNYPDIRLDPQICLDPDDYVHLFWWDERDGTGQEEIYYKTNRLVTGIEEISLEMQPSIELAAFPNPFKRTIEIRYGLADGVNSSSTLRESPQASRKLSWSLRTSIFGREQKPMATIKIYDVTGKLVKSFNHLLVQLSNRVIWDGKDDSGRNCSPGIYFSILQSGEASKSLKLVRIPSF